MMTKAPNGVPLEKPPSFEAARTRRQKARAAGLDPNYWYAVEQSSRLRPGQVLETMFWGRSIAVYRDAPVDGVGQVHALENRCAHRSIKLSEGKVEGCRLTCPYHGWSYDGTGLAQIPHDLYGTKNPQFRIDALPTQERYGLIFIFPGDPKLAPTRSIPDIPELAGNTGWASAIAQFDNQAHHSMLLDNVSDFTHGFLHRKYQPFQGMKLLRLETIEERVELEYEAKIAAHPWQDMFMERSGADSQLLRACYDYPYHWSIAEGGRVKLFLFVLPRDESSNRHFFLLCMSPRSISLPGLRGWTLPFWLRQWMCDLTRRYYMDPLFAEDVWVLEQEQLAWEKHWDRPAPEISPVAYAFEDLTIRKWEQYLASVGNSKCPSHGEKEERPRFEEGTPV